MSGFASGLGFLILILVLLFTWLIVATFVTAELAAFMGLLLIALWFFFFVPLGVLRELIWQGRQKKIMQQALAQTPAYAPGTLLTGPSHNSLTLTEAPTATGGALDVYRDLPMLPALEPRDHMLGFKRALVLPVIGLLMFLGANNDTVIYALLEARGLTQSLPIAWNKLELPVPHEDLRNEFRAAARTALRRERACRSIVGGALSVENQFASSEPQILAGKYVYELYCMSDTKDAPPFMIWMRPGDIGRGPIDSLFHALASPPTDEQGLKECRVAANEALKTFGAQLMPHKDDLKDNPPLIYAGRMPHRDFLRVISREPLQRAGQYAGVITVSCWVGSNTPAQVHFSRKNP